MKLKDDRLSIIQNWIFDLDNTLYSSKLGILESLYERSIAFIQDELKVNHSKASELKELLSQEYGTIARGLELRFGIAQHDFHSFIHSVPLGCLRPDLELAQILRLLPGKKFVHTNAPQRHADAVLERLQLSDSIDTIYSIEDASGIPKPSEENYMAMIERTGIDPTCSCFFDDQLQNLAFPRTIGMLTVLVSDSRTLPPDRTLPHWQVESLAGFFLSYIDR
jgi:putative hydrolase of the HAD superfamily